MTFQTDFGLGGLCQVFGILLMYFVTVRTGQDPSLVSACLPHRHFALVVALQANVVLFFLRFGRFGTQGENPAALAFFGVLRSGAMTYFTGKFLIAGCRGPGLAFDAVDGFRKILVNFFVAFHAGFIACIVSLQLAAAGIGRKEK